MSIRLGVIGLLTLFICAATLQEVKAEPSTSELIAVGKIKANLEEIDVELVLNSDSTVDFEQKTAFSYESPFPKGVEGLQIFKIDQLLPQHTAIYPNIRVYDSMRGVEFKRVFNFENENCDGQFIFYGSNNSVQLCTMAVDQIFIEIKGKLLSPMRFSSCSECDIFYNVVNLSFPYESKEYHSVLTVSGNDDVIFEPNDNINCTISEKNGETIGNLKLHKIQNGFVCEGDVVPNEHFLTMDVYLPGRDRTKVEKLESQEYQNTTLKISTAAAMAAGFSAMAALIGVFLNTRNKLSFMKKDESPLWKTVLHKLYTTAANQTYFSAGKIGFWNDDHPLARDLKISGGDLGKSLSFLNDQNLITGYTGVDTKFVSLTESGFKVSMDNEKSNKDHKLQFSIAIFTIILGMAATWDSFSRLVEGTNQPLIKMLFNLAMGISIILMLIFYVLKDRKMKLF